MQKPLHGLKLGLLFCLFDVHFFRELFHLYNIGVTSSQSPISCLQMSCLFYQQSQNIFNSE